MSNMNARIPDFFEPDVPESSKKYLAWTQQLVPNERNERERTSIVSGLAIHARTIPKHADAAYKNLVNWANALLWDATPKAYILCLKALEVNNTVGLRRCWEQNPQLHFRFELMSTLNNELLNATSAANMFAQQRGLSRDSLLERLLIQWDAKSGQGQLMPAKRMLDTFYTKPEDLNNRKECTVYAMTMFSALKNTYDSLHGPDNFPIVSPPDLFALPANLSP